LWRGRIARAIWESGDLLVGGVMRYIYGLPNLGLSTSFHEVEA
jgi:hypothetical protein